MWCGVVRCEGQIDQKRNTKNKTEAMGLGSVCVCCGRSRIRMVFEGFVFFFFFFYRHCTYYTHVEARLSRDEGYRWISLCIVTMAFWLSSHSHSGAVLQKFSYQY